ncbi:hypothetical protein TGME49_203875 [Toxoplasma gondii ME49]|uniref:Uncharacterized protein n=2 Tax=Toxoplasma gondii TaxID=5811 RepID=A0A2G8XX30_TOXGO|nr:hypothetical protein TGME49_203875 [Toxoplasma gondii ME49]EPT30080.1 hypothetical protein TGME49_203875 [Toxoplasma gondii ME49]PIL99577.1 hypothetical protein TGCOUG_203875 [Toxoplasma gondii COUG]|eukprot:XP_018637333.1 hypothetical protein TGME49_203875 [Toxoplasma gondii ME49]
MAASAQKLCSLARYTEEQISKRPQRHILILAGRNSSFSLKTPRSHKPLPQPITAIVPVGRRKQNAHIPAFGPSSGPLLADSLTVFFLLSSLRPETSPYDKVLASASLITSRLQSVR